MKKIRTLLMPLVFTAPLVLIACDGGYEPPPDAEPMDSIAPMPKTQQVPGTDDPNE